MIRPFFISRITGGKPENTETRAIFTPQARDTPHHGRMVRRDMAKSQAQNGNAALADGVPVMSLKADCCKTDPDMASIANRPLASSGVRREVCIRPWKDSNLQDMTCQGLSCTVPRPTGNNTMKNRHLFICDNPCYGKRF